MPFPLPIPFNFSGEILIMGGGGGSNPGPVSCGSWIRRPENVNLALIGKSRRPDSSPSTFEIFSFDPKTTSLSSSPLVWSFPLSWLLFFWNFFFNWISSSACVTNDKWQCALGFSDFVYWPNFFVCRLNSRLKNAMAIFLVLLFIPVGMKLSVLLLKVDASKFVFLV